tara:strand:- start:2939 stop:3091 length:153 start_codon:yes stop_codon:yes gene_type:complete
MLFKFGKFWRAVLLLLSSWIFYGIFDFEFTIVTLLALLIALHTKEFFKHI